MTGALALTLALLATRSPGLTGFLFSRPSSLDGDSLRLWATRGAWPLLLAGGTWLAARGLGRRLLAAAGAAPSSGTEGVAAAALGLGLAAQSVFLAYWGGAPAWTPLALLVGLTLAARDLPGLLRPARLDGARTIATALLGYAAACATVRALAPAIEWDARAYHLALPELYARAGRLVAAPWMIHSHWPHLMEVLDAPLLALGLDGTAALVSTGAAAALVLGVAHAAGPGEKDPAPWAAALLLAGQPALLKAAGTAHADAAAALFAFGAAVLLARWERDGRDATLAAAGLLAGFGASAKMLGLGALASWTAWVLWRTRRPAAAALFLGAGLCAVGPWLARSFVLHGDPVWPFAAGLFGAGREASDLAARYMRATRWDLPPAWLLVHDGPLLLLLPLAGLAALSSGRRAPPSRLEMLLLIPAPFYLAATFRHNEAWRFFLPCAAALALAAARGFSAAWRAGGARRTAAASLVLAGAAAIPAVEVNNELFAVLAPRPSSGAPDRRTAWEERALPLAGFYREARGVLPREAKVLLWRETRGYGAGFDYLWGDPINQAQLEVRRIPDPDAMLSRLKELGVTHVLENPGSGLYREDPGYYDARSLALMAEALRRGGKVLLARDGLVLHQLL